VCMREVLCVVSRVFLAVDCSTVCTGFDTQTDNSCAVNNIHSCTLFQVQCSQAWIRGSLLLSLRV
jgi:hypothetical protein